MIHKFSMNGYNMVLDVDGGSVHILDDVAYELVDLYEENTKEEIIAKLEDKFTAEQIDEAYDEITSLKEEGLFVGPSCGAALLAALRYTKDIKDPLNVLVLFPDSGSKYLSKAYNDEWMKSKGFLS